LARETLRDGRPLEIRALKPSDREGLLSAVGRMSGQAIYRGFFAPKPRITDREAGYFLNVDLVTHIALARYWRNTPAALRSKRLCPDCRRPLMKHVVAPGTDQVIAGDAHRPSRPHGLRDDLVGRMRRVRPADLHIGLHFAVGLEQVHAEGNAAQPRQPFKAYRSAGVINLQ
jgi:hypothetical protein